MESKKDRIKAYILLNKSNDEIVKLCNVSLRTVQRYRKEIATNDTTGDTKNDKRQNDKNKIDWIKLENEYVTDISDNPITLKGLSEKYNVSFNTIQDYSADNNWSDKRQKYHRNITEKTQEKLSDKTANVMAQIINNVNSALLQATEELHIHEEVNGFGKLITIPTDTVRVGKLSKLVKAITSIQKIELEKEKIQIEKQKHNPTNNKKNTVSAFIDKLEELL